MQNLYLKIVNIVPLHDIGLYILALVLLITIIALLRLEFRLKRFLIGKNAKDFEESIDDIVSRLKVLEVFKEVAIEQFTQNDEKLGESVRAIETIRFNPFKGTGSGGNQSFSTALLNENGDGVVLTCLYARERTSVFCKPIKEGKSDFELSEEEIEVLEKASKKLDLK